MKALVNKIIHSSLVDGPGNRAAIFFQGCNYHCSYCHNPETIAVCSGCGLCVEKCPAKALTLTDGKIVWNAGLCCQCDQCIHTCPSLASPRVRAYTPEEVMAAITPDLPYIRGITVSGGECSLQRDFLMALFRLAKEKHLSTLMDSNGSYDYMADQELMAVCDGIMLDVKACDDEAHRKLTGMSSQIVMENAVKLARAGKLEEIRTVIVPDELPNTDTVETITKKLRPYLQMRQIRYKLIAYRPWGVRPPYKEQFRTPDADEMHRYQAIAQKNGFQNVLIV